MSATSPRGGRGGAQNLKVLAGCAPGPFASRPDRSHVPRRMPQGCEGSARYLQLAPSNLQGLHKTGCVKAKCSGSCGQIWQAKFRAYALSTAGRSEIFGTVCRKNTTWEVPKGADMALKTGNPSSSGCPLRDPQLILRRGG